MFELSGLSYSDVEQMSDLVLNKIFDITKQSKNTNVTISSNLDNLIAYFLVLEILEDRHGKQSTIITFQLLVANWHEIIDEATIADAILDRVDHFSHRIELNGVSLRKRE